MYSFLRVAVQSAAALLLVVTCATPYQPTSFAGGYEETWLSEREVVVSFSANGYTSPKTAADYAAFRTCELALENGFTHFIVLDDEATVAQETSTIRAERIDVVPNAYGGVTATSRPAQTITTFKPATRLHVVLLKEKEVEAANARGHRVVSARFYIEKNAPLPIKSRILPQH